MNYKTQMEAAKMGIVTPQMQTVAEKERREPEWIRERVAAGTIAIPANIHHTSLSAEGIGDWAYPQRPVDVRFFHEGRVWAECGTDEGTFYCCIRDHQREARLLLNALNANYSWER